MGKLWFGIFWGMIIMSVLTTAYIIANPRATVIQMSTGPDNANIIGNGNTIRITR